MNTVIIYTTSTCAYCKMAKDFFREHKIDYKEINVESDPAAAQEMINKSGQMGVPVIDVNGEIVVGFDQTKLSQLLGVVEE